MEVVKRMSLTESELNSEMKYCQNRVKELMQKHSVSVIYDLPDDGTYDLAHDLDEKAVCLYELINIRWQLKGVEENLEKKNHETT